MDSDDQNQTAKKKKTTTSGPWICSYNLCHKEYSRKSHYLRHLRAHSGEKPFECEICGKQYARKEHLIRHQNSHTKQLKYTCSYESCGKSFYNPTHLRRHEITHQKIYQCEICKKGFSKHYLYQRHLRNHKFDKALTEDQRYCCIYTSCNSIYSTLAALKRHCKSHEHPKNFSCVECNVKFTKQTDLSSHKRLSHPRTYSCDVCHTIFKRKIRLKNHLQKYHGEDNLIYFCPFKGCTKSFTRRSNLIAHSKLDHSESQK